MPFLCPRGRCSKQPRAVLCLIGPLLVVMEWLGLGECGLVNEFVNHRRRQTPLPCCPP